MIRIKILPLLLFISSLAFGVGIKPPYSNNFDLTSDTAGWSHYALQGTDDWQRGVPNGSVLYTALSAPNVWATNLNGKFTANSVMALETPFFDLTDTTKFMLCFLQEYESAPYHGGNIEYSVDSGKTWTLLNGAPNEKYNWYNNNAVPILNNQPAWSGNGQFYFAYAAHSLVFLKGKPAVKFRFKFGGSTNPLEGWVLDNFAIIPEGKNIVATKGVKIETSKNRPLINVSSTFVYSTFFPTTFNNTTNYYFSYDKVYDTGDTYLGNKTGNVSGTTINFTKSLNMPTNLIVGTYYILYQHDANDLLTGEISDTDNWNYAELQIDTTYLLPVNFDFEKGASDWKGVISPMWSHGTGPRHHLDGAHSGVNGWYEVNGNSYSRLESPFLDLTSLDTLYIGFWFKNVSGGTHQLMYSMDDGLNWSTGPIIPICLNDDWDFFNYPLASIGKVPFMKFAFFSPNMVVDDIYIGKPRADLGMEDDKANHNTSTASLTDSIKYQLANAGVMTCPTTISKFYWSADSILDASDKYLGSKTELPLSAGARSWTWFSYTKPTTTAGKYYIHFILDSANASSEMRETNNTGYFVIYQDPFPVTPYFNDFESQVNGWRHNSTLNKDDWRWSTPNLFYLSQAFSGTKAWVTNANPLVSPMSRMHLYTPVFDLSNALNPVLEFDMKMHSHPSCFCFDGKTNMSYSIDGGATWTVLDTTNQSYNNWYYSTEFDDWGGIDRIYLIPNYTQRLFGLQERAFVMFQQYNGRDADRNTRFILDLTFLKGKPRVQFRYNMATDINNSQSANFPAEGAIIDNFSIREKFVDLTVNYRKALMMSSIAGEVKFQINIKNDGNYISKACSTKYYLSVDSVLSGGDYLLMNDFTPAIRPDLNYYSNRKIIAPSQLSTYNYLIYQLDANNVNIESNELNNVGYWTLALDSVSTYPYKQDFSDTVLNGWHHYVTNKNFGLLQTQWRFRNKVAPGEPLYSTKIKEGEMFTDRINGAQLTGQVPIWMLETPSFDFSKWDSISISFKRLSSGKNTGSIDGGCMDFSTDGGYNFTPLTTTYGNAYNWYNTTNYWAFTPGTMDSCWFNTNFLKGQKHVVFRFRYSSNIEWNGGGTVQGMRIDDFVIRAKPLNVSVPEKKWSEGSIFSYGKQVFIRLPENAEAGMYTFSVINSLGQIVAVDELELQKGFNHHLIGSDLATGVYFLELRNSAQLLREKVVLFSE